MKNTFYKFGRFEIILENVAGISDLRPGGAPGQTAYDVLVNGAAMTRDKPGIMDSRSFAEEREKLIAAWHKCMGGSNI